MGTVIRQLFDTESSTYTYLLTDQVSGLAVIIDPVLEQLSRDLQLIEELGLKLEYALDTHVHADHITALGALREATKCRTGMAASAGANCADLMLREGDIVPCGSIKLRILETPGHTNGCLSFYDGENIFTGDALLIRGCGRTDFQEGSSAKLYHSVTEKLFRLPLGTRVFPAHDYKGFTSSTIEEEKKWNPRLTKPLAEFTQIMDSLGLAPPKKLDVAVPANRNCGTKATPH